MSLNIDPSQGVISFCKKYLFSNSKNIKKVKKKLKFINKNIGVFLIKFFNIW
jgi:hypothetical protein